jgi:hypothetical protein
MVFRKTRKYVRNLFRKKRRNRNSKEKTNKNRRVTAKNNIETVRRMAEEKSIKNTQLQKKENKITHDLINLNNSFRYNTLPNAPQNAPKISNDLLGMPYNYNANMDLMRALHNVNRNTKKRNEYKQRQHRIGRHIKGEHEYENKYKAFDLIDLTANNGKNNRILSNGTVDKKMKNMAKISESLRHSKKFRKLDHITLISEVNNMIDHLKRSGYSEQSAILHFLNIIHDSFGIYYHDRSHIIRDLDGMDFLVAIAEWEETEKDLVKRENMIFMNEIILFQENKKHFVTREKELEIKEFLYDFARKKYKNDPTYNLVLQYINKM